MQVWKEGDSIFCRGPPSGKKVRSQNIVERGEGKSPSRWGHRPAEETPEGKKKLKRLFSTEKEGGEGGLGEEKVFIVIPYQSL